MLQGTAEAAFRREERGAAGVETAMEVWLPLCYGVTNFTVLRISIRHEPAYRLNT